MDVYNILFTLSLITLPLLMISAVFNFWSGRMSTAIFQMTLAIMVPVLISFTSSPKMFLMLRDTFASVDAVADDNIHVIKLTLTVLAIIVLLALVSLGCYKLLVPSHKKFEVIDERGYKESARIL